VHHTANDGIIHVIIDIYVDMKRAYNDVFDNIIAPLSPNPGFYGGSRNPERDTQCVSAGLLEIYNGIGSEFEVRVTNYLASEAGVITNVAEYPVVPRGSARFRLQVQADHTVGQMSAAGAAISQARDSAKKVCSEMLARGASTVGTG